MEGEKKTEALPKISVREVSLPKGGGAMKGIGGSFQANLFSGAGTYSIPIPVTVARGFEPELSLSYSSGSGNGAFGLGYSFSLPKISVVTNRGIPKYDGTDQYQLNGQRLSVKKSTPPTANPRKVKDSGKSYYVTTYLPWLEGSFAQIECWKEEASGISFWKVLTADNITSIYGQNENSRIANPAMPSQIFEWLVDESTDAKGNKIIYEYKKENAENVPTQVYEHNRSVTANRYIHQIKYGNYLDEIQAEKFAFAIVFNYGEGEMPGSQAWAYRPDPFSIYNSGFEIRTYRLCQKIQLIHYFPEESLNDALIKEIVFDYHNKQNYAPVELQGLSLLSKVTISGYRENKGGIIEQQTLPALELRYSSFRPPSSPEFKELSMGTGTIPGFLNATFLPVDLNGEGLPGFLYSNADASFFLEPLGDGQYQLPQVNATFPIHRNVQHDRATLADLDGNGELELLVQSGNSSGFYLRDKDGGWDDFIPFEKYPSDVLNADIESSDLDANGKRDLLLAGKEQIMVYPSEGKKGFRTAKYIPNEHGFPLVKKDFRQELVTFANIFGDGLSHRIKINSSSVECWPCLGYGRFGNKVTLANAPVFDDNFDARRLFLADIDGSGTADLIYVYPNRIELYINQSGNSFSDPIVVHLPELYGTIDQISFADILGHGTSCLVFTKIAPVPRHYYYNFSGQFTLSDGTPKHSLKPYLLCEINNNMGSLSFINYCSSTKFILEDKKAGRPWITKLPFPVQLVEELITYDLLTKSRYVSKYQYHDGYYNPQFREFSGFGFVESWDTESYEDFQNGYSNPDFPVSALNKELFVPPVYTKTWLLNGAGYMEYHKLLAKYKSEYFNKDKDAYPFPDTEFYTEIYNCDPKTFFETYSALAGKAIRKEIYGADQLLESSNPYIVEESNYQVVLIQPSSQNNRAVFRIDTRESITYHYERNSADPRINQQFVLETDPLSGKPARSCSVALPRRNLPANPLFPEQYLLKTAIATTSYFNTPDDSAFRLRGIAYDEQEFELLGMSNGNTEYFTFDQINTAVNSALDNIIPYQALPTPGYCQARQIERSRSYFWNLDQNGVLKLGEVSPRSLLHHVATAEFTNDNISTMFGEQLTEQAIQQLGGYIYDPDTCYWENQGLIQNYFKTPESFYQPSGTESSTPDLGMEHTIQYDRYFLAPVKTLSVVGADISGPIINETSLSLDYQAMAPKQLVNMNGNVSQVLFDALGQVIVSTLFGNENGSDEGGMRLYEYQEKGVEYKLHTTSPQGDPIDFNSVIKNPEYFLQGAISYFYYDLNAFTNAGQPANAIHLIRENYYHLSDDTSAFSCQVSIAYSDGLGRSIGQKQKMESENTKDQWFTSGRVVYNNKGKVCEAYLPYFTDTPFYQQQSEITDQSGVVPPPLITHYDPLLRVIKKDTPKGFFSKVEFTPWQQIDSDEDDTVIDSIYYQNFMNNYPPQPTQEQKDEKDALDKAAKFYQTPAISVFDNTGNVIRHIQTLEDKRLLATFYQLDIQGRKIIEADPRLYVSDLYNFKYQYTMSADQPMVTDSADAGIQKHFYNIFGKQCWSLSPREYCQVIYYDWQQRQTQLKVKNVSGTAPVTSFDDFNLVEEWIYGEDPQAPAGHNLRGHIWRLKDLSGIVINSEYSMLGKILETSRQMAKEYRKPIDWNNKIELEPKLFNSSFSYNALSLKLSETTPDGSITKNLYNQAGLLYSVTLTNSKDLTQFIIKNINYNANRQRTRIDYGNGVVTKYTYEASTLRLTQITNLRPSLPPEQLLQDIKYTYDPAGNITRTRDDAIETIFYNNQKVDPLADYTYDAIYRLVTASGRQHPGIKANASKNNIVDGNFKQSIFSQLPVSNGQALENYREIYSYDDSGNLVKKQHKAVLSSWTTNTPVEDNSNQLKGLQYDASGNQRQLNINNTVSLYFNCCENLLSARTIERPQEANDADYYVYDSTEQRTRKVSEKYNNGTSFNYCDTIYLGTYELKREGVQNAVGSRTVTTERQTLRIMDGITCIAIVYQWEEGGPGSKPGKPAIDQIRYQFTNNLGSVTLELDENASLISYEEYFPYGGTAIIAGANQVEVALKVYRYSGKECDDSTGLYYYGRRYYVSWLGRWLKPDPAGTVDGLNLFAFVKGRPVVKRDRNGLAITPNPYEWIVSSSTTYISPDLDINNVLENFGHPITSVVQKYDDLARRIGHDVSHNYGVLSTSTVANLHLAFDASIPLHYGFNDFLGVEWRGNMGTYAGSKRRIPLYSVMRSKTTTQFKSEVSVPGYGNFNEVLFEVSQRPAEVHHVLYKALRPQYANQTSNLMLVERSPKESVYGPGQHELMHMLGSGNNTNKFSVLLPQFESEYITWYQNRKSVATMKVSHIE